MSSEEWQRIAFLLGPWVVGSFIDILLQGVLLCQCANYYSWYRDDKKPLRYAVLGLFLMSTAKSVQAFAAVWQQNIVFFSNLDGAIELPYRIWYMSLNGLFTALIGAYVQFFFCWRLYVISGKRRVVGPIACLLTFGFIASCFAAFYTFHEEQSYIRTWYALHLGSVFVGDTLMAIASAYYLLQRKPEDGLKRTDDLVNALVRLTFQCAAPAALFAMLNFILALVYNENSYLISVSANMTLAKLYAVSMMYTLNARRSIRLTHSLGELTEEDLYRCAGISSVRFRTTIIDEDIEAELRGSRFPNSSRPSHAVCIQMEGLKPHDACEVTPTTDSGTKIGGSVDSDSTKGRAL